MKTDKQGIGRWQGAGMMATTLLGTGVFILPQLTVAQAEFSALYAWILLTVAIVPVTLIFGKLAARFAHAAGPAYFVEKAFGKVAGRVIGLMFMCVVPIGAPAAIVMTFMFVQQIVPVQGQALLLGQLSTLLFLWLINLRGIQVSAKLQFALTLIILALVILLFGKSNPTAATFNTSSFDTYAMLGAAGIAFWSFLGVEAMSHLSDDFRNPEKDMIPAMLIGTVLVGAVYVACTLLVIAYPNNESLSMVGLFNAFFGELFGHNGHYVIGVLGVAGGLATVNVYTASLARLICSFAEQGVLPSYLAKRNEFNVPLSALTTLMLVIALVLIATFYSQQDLEDLINWVNGVFVVIYAAAMLAAWRLLSVKNRPMILLGLGFCIALAIGIGAHMIYAFILMAVITPFVILQKRKQLTKVSNA
jgi:amino acid efflux transporter